eukprot:999672_1
MKRTSWIYFVVSMGMRIQEEFGLNRVIYDIWMKMRGSYRRRQSECDEREQGNEERTKGNNERKNRREKWCGYMTQNRSKKRANNIVEVSMEHRKSNKRVAFVPGFIEKAKDKERNE